MHLKQSKVGKTTLEIYVLTFTVKLKKKKEHLKSSFVKWGNSTNKESRASIYAFESWLEVILREVINIEQIFTKIKYLPCKTLNVNSKE